MYFFSLCTMYNIRFYDCKEEEILDDLDALYPSLAEAVRDLDLDWGGVFFLI